MVDVSLIISPVKNSLGQVTGASAIARDITDKRRAEYALKEAEAQLAHISRVATMGELASSIAHEINQPLAAIVNDGAACLRWLQCRPPALDEARESVQHMIGDANRASHVIARIRALLARKRSAKSPFDPNDLVRDTVALVNGEIALADVTLRCDLASGNLAASVFGVRFRPCGAGCRLPSAVAWVRRIPLPLRFEAALVFGSEHPLLRAGVGCERVEDAVEPFDVH